MKQPGQTRRGRHVLAAVPHHAAEATQTVERVLADLISHKCNLGSAARILGLLIVEACVLQLPDLEPAYLAARSAFRTPEGVFIEWEGGTTEGTERRAIGVFLQLLLNDTGNEMSFSEAHRELEAWLTARYLGVRDPLVKTSSIQWLLSQVQAFARLALPNAIFLHVAGMVPFALLPRRCLARQSTGLAIQEPLAISPQPKVTDRTFDRALDAALLGQPASFLSAPAFIRRVLSALRPPANGSIASKRRSIAIGLCALEAELDGQCTAAQILLAFAIDLHENGTAQSPILAPTTPYDYTNAVAMLFLGEFSDIRFERLDVEDFSKRFAQLLSASTSPKHAAGCQALYQFLRRWDLVPKFVRPMDYETDLAPVATAIHANLIHRHELDMLFDWLDSAELSRLHQSARCALAVLEAIPLRVGELLSLRLDGIRTVDGGIEVDVAPRLSDPRLKSRESRRRALIATDRGIKIVGDWLQRRFEEEDSLQAQAGYLFGDPNLPGSVYRPTALTRLLNSLLKAVSGDSLVSIHTLRHTWATRSISNALLSLVDDEVNALDNIATQMGHADVSTTLTRYFHAPEGVVQAHWDRALSSLVPMSSSDLEYWTNVPAATWRQRFRRGSVPLAEAAVSARSAANYSRNFSGQALKAIASQVPFSGPERGILMGYRCIPFLGQQPIPIDFTMVLGALTDLALGLNTHQVALRQQVTNEDLIRILAEVANASNVLTGSWRPHTRSVARCLEMLMDSSGSALGIRPDFSRLLQPRWRPLRRWLERHWQEPMAHCATSYWLSHVRGGCVTVDLGALEFLRIFPEAGCNSALAQLHVNGSLESLSTQNRLAFHSVEVLFYEVFGQAFTRHFLAPRRGRPLFQFVFGAPSANSSQSRKNGAAQSLAGLHCLMLVTLIAQRLRNSDHE
jgi:integrase